MKVVVIKYNAGNIQSVKFALNRLGVEPIVTDNITEINAADKVIFPGVGEASSAMNYLKEKQLDQVIKQLKQPVLGICLGMQLLCKHSEEGDTNCIGIFDAEIKKAGIGILISEEFRKNGFASEALKLLVTHCFNKLYLRQLYCNIHADNIASLNLFKKNGFSQIKNENDTLLLEITN